MALDTVTPQTGKAVGVDIVWSASKYAAASFGKRGGYSSCVEC